MFHIMVCDGENDCNDLEISDEQNCTKMLPESNTKSPISPNNTYMDWLWQCNNEISVPDWWRCDGIDDCGDNSDEVGCELVMPETKLINSSYSKCEKYEFPCAPDNCVPLAWACDGTPDCPGGTDERYCEPKSRPTATCASEETPCADRKFCIKNSQLCDGVIQCADGSDEIQCPKTLGERPVDCPFGYIECNDGLCVSQAIICNGRKDCSDGSDELNCSNTSDDRMYQSLNIGVDQSSINSTSFLISFGMAQQKITDYSFLPSISNVSGGEWTNISWINDSTYRFINLEPYTNYNVTFYIRDKESNKTYPSDKYASTSTVEGAPSPPRELTIKQVSRNRTQVSWNPPENPRGVIQYYELYYSPPIPPIMTIISANNTNDQSIPFEGVLVSNTNYSFWGWLLL